MQYKIHAISRPIHYVSLYLCLIFIPIFSPANAADTLVSPQPSIAHTPTETCNIQDAWAPPSLKGATLGVVYFTASSPIDNTVLGAKTSVAQTAELHTHIKKDSVLQMRKIEHVDLPADTPVNFAPAGLHVMLYNLKQPLLDNTSFPLSVTCAKGGSTEVRVHVSQARLLRALKSRMQ